MNQPEIMAAIANLEAAISSLRELGNCTELDLANISQIQLIRQQIKRSLLALDVTLNPPINHEIPTEIIDRLGELGIPVDDIEVRIALNTYHLSQIIGILAEIEQRYTELRRKREYFLLRLPDMPIEQLGSRLPYYTAADFPDVPKTSAETLAQLKAKYQLFQRQPDNKGDLFSKIREAEETLARYSTSNNQDSDNNQLPF